MSKNNSFKIGNRNIGPGHSVFIVAEIGLNHNGDMGLAKKTIEAAAEAGADGVKFQNYKTEDFISDDELTYEYENNGKLVKETQKEMFKRCELSDAQLKELKDFCDSAGVVFHSTPTSEAGVDILKKINSKVIKNGSDFLTNSPLLKLMAKSEIPVVIATGMADEREIAEAVSTIRNAGCEDLIVLHCTSSYPTKMEDVNLRRMLSIRDKFDCLTGLSDHSEGYLAAVAATALGACWVEKHFTMDRTLPGPDHRFSSDPRELKELVLAVRAIEKAMGNPSIAPAKSEEEARKEYRLSCAAAHTIPKGHVLKEQDIIFRRPATGIPPSKVKTLVGKTVNKDVNEAEIFSTSDLD